MEAPPKRPAAGAAIRAATCGGETAQGVWRILARAGLLRANTAEAQRVKGFIGDDAGAR